MKKIRVGLFFLVVLWLGGCAYAPGAEMPEHVPIPVPAPIPQSDLSEQAQTIGRGRPVGESGMVIAPRYRGGLYFNFDNGILTVLVLPGAMEDEASATAIHEMLAMGIIVREVRFTHVALDAAARRLLRGAFDMGATGWSTCTVNNHIAVTINPYTDAQRELFMYFLQREGLEPDMFYLRPAITEEMQTAREASVAAAAASPRDILPVAGEVAASPTGISFALENRTDYNFYHGCPWDLAHYIEGRWVPVPFPPGRGGGPWTLLLYTVPRGGTSITYHIQFEWLFGELPPGRYLFIRQGWLGERYPHRENTYAVVEFILE
ncbi:MAG: hypothetical protein FWB88_06065 [Defluviitaleaceae bacterium]|nr:hypothetical protein [Defluviitaleaceae bacterium]MCL2238575.1 hypothetical protein [Defluviitaleaceae bacterium]